MKTMGFGITPGPEIGHTDVRMAECLSADDRLAYLWFARVARTQRFGQFWQSGRQELPGA